MNIQLQEKVAFPKASGININMMPFIIGDYGSIPEEYKSYVPILQKCKVNESEIGKVGYLSINESFVDVNKAQRRTGIHTEKHPSASWGGGGGGTGWGGKNGLYMASTVDNSCRAWDHHVEVTGLMGDCEHLREQLGEGIVLPSNQLVWMTDSCPHEALVLKESTHRQWVRFVTSEVGLWYAKHSTDNRLGVKPNCKIVYGSKF